MSRKYTEKKKITINQWQCIFTKHRIALKCRNDNVLTMIEIVHGKNVNPRVIIIQRIRWKCLLWTYSRDKIEHILQLVTSNKSIWFTTPLRLVFILFFFGALRNEKMLSVENLNLPSELSPSICYSPTNSDRTDVFIV